ncbi:MAG: proline racemase [Kiloniellaceae bacterium]|nr:proline racemase [Kiloniellaceae bacterium]
MHTGGEPLRIITSGYPKLEGRRLLDKRRDARANHDAFRRLLMHEPRGHAEMYGAVLVEPDDPEADLAVLFLHSEGYSTMCGHAIIALGRWAVDSGLVDAREPVTEVAIQAPCGLVRARVQVESGPGGQRAGAVSFRSVPSFAFAREIVVDTREWGPLQVDVAYGGAFYAILPADAIGLDVRDTPVRQLAEAGAAITEAATAQLRLSHPDDPDLAFLYGTLFTDGADSFAETPTRNVCVFAGRQVDRSPTGSGVAARLALQWTRGQIALGQARRFESLTGGQFTGTAVEETRAGPYRAIVAEISGQAHYYGRSHFTLEPDDPLGDGFLPG